MKTKHSPSTWGVLLGNQISDVLDLQQLSVMITKE